MTASQIRDNLYLGDLDDAVPLATQGYAVICVLEDLPSGEPLGAYWIPILVPTKATLTLLSDKASHEQLDLVMMTIDHLLSTGRKVLLHCAAGIERSPLAMAWYLSKKEGLTIDAAYKDIKGKRPFIADRRLWLKRNGHNYLWGGLVAWWMGEG